MKLREPDQRHQIALIRLERRFKRFALAWIIAQLPSRLGEIEPQRSSLGIGFRGRCKVLRRGLGIARIEELHSTHVPGNRVIRIEAQCFVERVSGLVRPTAPLRLGRTRQMLFDIHRHDFEDDRRFAIGSRWFPLHSLLWHASPQP